MLQMSRTDFFYGDEMMDLFSDDEEIFLDDHGRPSKPRPQTKTKSRKKQDKSICPGKLHK